MKDHFSVYFWGVRGSIPCPGPETVRYGGNTPCVEVKVNGHRIIFDGGTGLRVLGQSLMQEMPVEAHMFFTHTHWDHIQGFPFFTPAFIKGNTFHIHGVPAPNSGDTIEKRLYDQMLHPNFPVPLRAMGATLEFHDLEIGQSIDLGRGVIIENALLNHPGEAIGYRVNWNGYSVAYVTDTEHFPDRLDENVLFLARETDVLIYDATYTDEEYPTRVGWGHSTWQEAIKVAKAAKVKRLIIFHHDPLHNDEFLDRVANQVAQQFSESLLAHEGLVIHLLPEAVSTLATSQPIPNLFLAWIGYQLSSSQPCFPRGRTFKS